MGSNEFGIDSVLLQDYCRIQLLVSISKLSGESVTEIITHINMHRQSNTEEVQLQTLRFDDQQLAHDKFIRRFTKGSYIIILSDGEALFDSNVLSRLIKRIRYTPLNGISGSLVLYNKDLAVSKATRGRAFLWRRSALFRRTDMTPEKLHISDGIFCSCLPMVSTRANFGELQCRYTSKVEGGSKSKALNYIDLNATAQIFAHVLIDQICDKKPESLKNAIWLIEQSIRLINVNAKCFNGITNSNRSLLSLLELLRDNIRRNAGKDVYQIVLEKMRKEADRRIRLVFFTNEFSVWSSMKSTYEYARQNSEYSVKLVYLPYEHPNALTDHSYQLDLYADCGYELLRHYEYDVTNDSPDIAFVVKGYDMVPEAYCIRNLEHVIDRVVFLGYSLTWPSSTPELDRLRYQLPIHYLSWFIVTNQYGFEMSARKGYRGGSNCLLIGNTRLDEVNNLSPDQGFSDCIKARAGKRKIIAWNTHHAIDDLDLPFGTFLKYGKHVLEAFSLDPSVFLLWRPHPLFFTALRKAMGFSLEQEEAFWSRVNNMENVIVDRGPSYQTAFSVSDALISDCSSMATEFLFQKKPILMTIAPENDEFFHSTIRKALLVFDRDCDLAEFIQQVKDGADVCREARMRFVEQSLCYSENHLVAEKLFDVISKRFKDEILEVEASP